MSTKNSEIVFIIPSLVPVVGIHASMLAAAIAREQQNTIGIDQPVMLNLGVEDLSKKLHGYLSNTRIKNAFRRLMIAGIIESGSKTTKRIPRLYRLKIGNIDFSSQKQIITIDDSESAQGGAQ